MCISSSACLCPGMCGRGHVTAFIYVFSTCLGSAYCGSGPVLDVGNIAESKTSPCSPEGDVLVGGNENLKKTTENTPHY